MMEDTVSLRVPAELAERIRALTDLCSARAGGAQVTQSVILRRILELGTAELERELNDAGEAAPAGGRRRRRRRRREAP